MFHVPPEKKKKKRGGGEPAFRDWSHGLLETFNFAIGSTPGVVVGATRLTWMVDPDKLFWRQQSNVHVLRLVVQLL